MVREVFRSLFSSQPVRISPPQAKTPIGEDHAPTKAEMSLSFVATVMGASRIFPRRLSLSRQPFPKTMVEKKSQNRSCSETSSPFAPTAFLGFERSASLLPERPSQAVSLASYGIFLFTTLRISSGEFNGITVISTVTSCCQYCGSQLP